MSEKIVIDIESTLMQMWAHITQPTLITIDMGRIEQRVIKDLFDVVAPLNVACPRCKALVGFKCKRKQIYPKPWGKKKPQRKAWEYQSEQLPHKERVRESKIFEVEQALDGF